MKIPSNSEEPPTYPSLLPIHSCTSLIDMSLPSLLDSDPAIDTTYDFTIKVLSWVVGLLFLCFLYFLGFVESTSSCRLVKVREALGTSILLASLAFASRSFSREIPRSNQQVVPFLWEILQLELSIVLVLFVTAACPAVCGC